MTQYLLPAILLVLVLLVLVLVIRAFAFRGKSVAALAGELRPADGESAAEHLGRAVRWKTVSLEDRKQIDTAQFEGLLRDLERMYPTVHQRLDVDEINRFSLLYTWKGSNPALKPVLLASHSDVVPVDPATLEQWSYPPFEGRMVEDSIWGRGTLDNKHTLITILEAAEQLLLSGWQPERTVYLAFGHDEEISGLQGAAFMAAYLKSRGIELEALLDEGGAVLTDGLAGLKKPAALIGVAEKGYASLEFSLEGKGGHSSMPPQKTPIGVLSGLVAEIEENPLPANLEIVTEMFRPAGAHLPFATRLVFGNQWLFGGILRKRLEAQPSTNAMIRTTAAPTIFHAGVKDNVIPAGAAATVNFRLLPGDTLKGLNDTLRGMLPEGVRMNMMEGGAWEASAQTDFASRAATGLVGVVGQIYPEAIALPYLVSGATDSRHYREICPAIFRFSPCQLTLADIASVHGVNEHITIANLQRMVQFYSRLLEVWAGGG